MGIVPWKGETLQSGTRLYINGKEVELDGKVSQSQIPRQKGQVPSEEEPMEEVSPEPVVKSTGVAASSFYGAAKPKPKGPLYVCIPRASPDEHS